MADGSLVSDFATEQATIGPEKDAVVNAFDYRHYPEGSTSCLCFVICRVEVHKHIFYTSLININVAHPPSNTFLFHVNMHSHCHLVDFVVHVRIHHAFTDADHGRGCGHRRRYQQDTSCHCLDPAYPCHCQQCTE
jgi:hypothetical protein